MFVYTLSSSDHTCEITLSMLLYLERLESHNILYNDIKGRIGFTQTLLLSYYLVEVERVSREGLDSSTAKQSSYENGNTTEENTINKESTTEVQREKKRKRKTK